MTEGMEIAVIGIKQPFLRDSIALMNGIQHGKPANATYGNAALRLCSGGDNT
jgi:hypothetical protein